MTIKYDEPEDAPPDISKWFDCLKDVRWGKMVTGRVERFLIERYGNKVTVERIDEKAKAGEKGT